MVEKSIKTDPMHEHRQLGWGVGEDPGNQGPQTNRALCPLKEQTLWPSDAFYGWEKHCNTPSWIPQLSARNDEVASMPNDQFGLSAWVRPHVSTCHSLRLSRFQRKIRMNLTHEFCRALFGYSFSRKHIFQRGVCVLECAWQQGNYLFSIKKASRLVVETLSLQQKGASKGDSAKEHGFGVSSHSAGTVLAWFRV